MDLDEIKLLFGRCCCKTLDVVNKYDDDDKVEKFDAEQVDENNDA